MSKAVRHALLILSALSMFGCAGTRQPQPEAPAAEASYPSVQLVSWSDFHSGIYEYVKGDEIQGGLPVFMAAIEQAKGDGLSLLIDGGDMFQGAMPFNEAKGMGAIDVMNTLGIDAATLGNHEFDYGPGKTDDNDPRGALREAIAASKFPWVTANVVATHEDAKWPIPGLKPYEIIQKGPYRIAIIGLLSTETPIATTAAHVSNLEFQNPAEVLKKYIPEIVEQKPDFVIVNAHLTGTPVPLPDAGAVVTEAQFDGEISEILALPEEIRSHINLILSGHSHKSFIAYEGNITVIQSTNLGREITTMTLLGDKDGLHLERASIEKRVLSHERMEAACGEEKQPLRMIQVNGRDLMPSQAGADIVTRYENLMTENRCDIVSCFDEAIIKNYDSECPLGNLVTDSMRAYFPEADVAVINAGGLRIDMPRGPLYRENINSLMPFDNYLYLLELKGSDIIKTLKISSTMKHGITQVSGVKYQVEAGCKNPEDINGDGKIEDWENNCLCESPMINGVPIDPEKTYKLAISDFMVNGGDDHAGCFTTGKTIDVGPVVKKTILDYVKKHEGCYSRNELIKDDAPRITMQSCGGKFQK